MEIFKQKKVLFPIMVLVAVSLGFGTTFALSGTSEPNHSDSAEHADDHHESTAVQNEEETHDASTPADITADASIAQIQADKTVDLNADGATPTEVYLTVGQVLQFDTKDGQTHRIALGEGGTEHEHTSSTNSGDFGAGEAWRVRFDKVGTFFFHDHFNPDINVLVVVYDPDSKAEI